ncbi:MAG: hypothetical protein AAGI46_04565 [Planctomycetota bacterium]
MECLALDRNDIVAGFPTLAAIRADGTTRQQKALDALKADLAGGHDLKVCLPVRTWMELQHGIADARERNEFNSNYSNTFDRNARLLGAAIANMLINESRSAIPF